MWGDFFPLIYPLFIVKALSHLQKRPSNFWELGPIWKTEEYP